MRGSRSSTVGTTKRGLALSPRCSAFTTMHRSCVQLREAYWKVSNRRVVWPVACGLSRGILHRRVREAAQTTVLLQADDVAHVGRLTIEPLDRVQKARHAEPCVGANQDASVWKTRLEFAHEPDHQGRGVAVVARVAGTQTQTGKAALSVEHQEREIHIAVV